MNGKWLRRINISTIPVIFLIGILCWLLLPKEQLMWGAWLIFIILLLVAYLNVRKPLLDHIEARRTVKNKPVNVKSERRLRIINVAAIIAIFLIDLLSWFYLPREQFVWAIYLMILVLLLIGFINIGKILVDIS